MRHFSRDVPLEIVDCAPRPLIYTHASSNFFPGFLLASFIRKYDRRRYTCILID